MARPTTIQPETIIDAARAVFLERGIQATTAEVAERAGVSEGSIFRRFKTKVELFQAAMEGSIGSDLSWVADLNQCVGQGDLQQNLFDLALKFIGFFRKLMPLIMMSWSNPTERAIPSILQGPNPAPVMVVRVFAGFFEAEMRANRLRRHDPEVVARAFIGAMTHFVFLETLCPGDALPLPVETFVRGLIRVMWGGIAPLDETTTTNPSRS